MSHTEEVGVPLGKSLQHHVLDPLETAESVLEKDYEEVTTERRAFKQFRGQVRAIEIVSDASAIPATRTPLRETQSRAAERVRSAFRETIMDVDHYDEVYGESLVEHAAAELSDEVAAGLGRDTQLSFTHLYKRALLTAVGSAISQREAFCVTLDEERESLSYSRDRLEAVLADLDGTHVPAGVETDFTDALDEVARHRQEEMLSRRTASQRTDGYDLCAYLYSDCPWTHPVLTAVARLRGTVNGVGL